jgi:hypothetical protein
MSRVILSFFINSDLFHSNINNIYIILVVVFESTLEFRLQLTTYQTNTRDLVV